MLIRKKEHKSVYNFPFPYSLGNSFTIILIFFLSFIDFDVWFATLSTF